MNITATRIDTETKEKIGITEETYLDPAPFKKCDNFALLYYLVLTRIPICIIQDLYRILFRMICLFAIKVYKSADLALPLVIGERCLKTYTRNLDARNARDETEIIIWVMN